MAVRAAWINMGNVWNKLGFYDAAGHWFQDINSSFVGLNVQPQDYGGQSIAVVGGQIYPVSYTPSIEINPTDWAALSAQPQTPAAAQPATPPPSRSASPPTRSVRQPASGRAPAAAPGRDQGHRGATSSRTSASGSRGSRVPHEGSSQQWTVHGDGHAYHGANDLGLYVGDSRVVEPTNGGRLWALFTLSPEGRRKHVGAYGSVPGAPPPPNAHLNETAVPAAPAYGSPAYAAPAYASPAYGSPAYASPAYGSPAYGSPAYASPAYGSWGYAAPDAPLAGTPGIPSYDPVTGQMLTPAQAAYQGAAYGAQVAAQQAAAQQAAAQQAAAYDPYAGFLYGGSCGGLFCDAPGMDTGLLAQFSGGDEGLMSLYASMYGDPYGGMLTAY